MSAFEGKKVVLTGTFSEYKRTELKKMLLAAGAKVTGSVSGKTDCLCYGANAGSKFDKAEALGIDTYDESETLALLNASGPAKTKKKAAPKKTATKAKRTAAKKAKAAATPASSGPFSGKKVVITGTFEIKRTELKKMLEAAGARVMSGVSRNTDCLVYGENGGSKYNKAEQLEIDLYDESETMALLGTTATASEKKAKKPAKKAAKKAAPQATASSGGGGSHSIRLVADSSSGGKFWECSLDGCEMTTTFGKLGSNGQTRTKSFASEEKAVKEFEKQVRAKKKKGYDEE